ncbi:MAG: hypothetical protein ABIQ89_04090 [Candidatus Saccharimonadales bacterium]
MNQPKNFIRKLAAFWAILGVSLIFIEAIVRMVPYFARSLEYKFGWQHWLVLVIWCAFMIITEGYRGFQKQFSPMVAARVMYLLHGKPKLIDLILAPIFCMGYFHATRKRLKRTWLLTLGIIILIIIVRQFNQPWRGIIDSGVMLGLSYGLATIFYFTGKSLISGDSSKDAQVGP